MNLYSVVFYLLAILILAATGLAVTRKNPVHAVVFLVFSFLGSAMLYFLLGAPFLAALEVIIYAGAIMILFLFVIMMLRVDVAQTTGYSLAHWMPPIILGLLFLGLSALAVFREPDTAVILKPAMATPGDFGRFIYERYWLAVEIISLLLLTGLLAAVLVGKGQSEKTSHQQGREGGGQK
jgi:NADH-quinone oxidoreductase subunit J